MRDNIIIAIVFLASLAGFIADGSYMDHGRHQAFERVAK